MAFQRGTRRPCRLCGTFERRGDGEIAAHLGAYWRLGRRNRARQAWLGGLEKDPEDPCWWKRYGAYWVIGPDGMRRQLSRGLGGV